MTEADKELLRILLRPSIKQTRGRSRKAQGKNDQLNDVAAHLPEVSVELDKACRKAARLFLQGKRGQGLRVLIGPTFEDYGLDGDWDLVFDRVRCYADRLRELSPPKPLVRSQRPHSAPEVGQACLDEFLSLEVRLASIASETLNAAWFRYFEPKGGTPGWMVAEPPSIKKAGNEAEKAAHAAYELLCLWQSHFDSIKPPQGLLAQLRKARRKPAEFQTWLSAQLTKAPKTVAREILPRGRWRRVSRDDARLWYGQEGWYGVDWDRFEFLESLNPLNRYTGEHLSSNRYLAFEFEKIVVAESNHEGNALYYVSKEKGDWKFILTLSKAESLTAGAKRIIHDPEGNWKRRLRQLLEDDRR